jgi:uncharacterized protein YdeI (BOF family)
MKKLLAIITAAVLVTGVAFAAESIGKKKKKKCAKKENCATKTDCKKDGGTATGHGCCKSKTATM